MSVVAAPKVKCVVWDLDNTLWSGTLSEGDDVTLRPGVLGALELLDARGILQSVASKNDYDFAWPKLQALGVDHFFLYPQIHWNSKAESIQQIQKDLNIGFDTFAFLDDQPFEREEVSFHLPEVRSFEPENLGELFQDDVFIPRFMTDDSRRRRAMYQSDALRKTEEAAFKGPNEAFLTTLEMRFTVRPAEEADLQRAEELTVRTNQLNTTGQTYSYEELAAILASPDHQLLVAELVDRFGSYGTIGLVLLKCEPEAWTIELLLMSCRVMSRGVGGALITFLQNEALARKVRLRARFRPTDRNRMMYVTYKFAGFHELPDGEPDLLENDLSNIPVYPRYLEIDAHL